MRPHQTQGQPNLDHPVVALLGDPTPLLVGILEKARASNIDLSNLLCDHVCYRVATQERYTELRNQLHTLGTCVTEANVRGRPIATFQLHLPLTIGIWTIPSLELPSPKVGSSYAEGWEHAEFVIPEGVKAFIEKHKSVAFDTSGLDREINPELALSVSALTQMKFHQLSLLEVIAIEKGQ